MKAFKGFNKDLTCRGFQYEEGKEFHTEKRIAVMRDFMRVSILWIVLVITIRLRVFSMR